MRQCALASHRTFLPGAMGHTIRVAPRSATRDKIQTLQCRRNRPPVWRGPSYHGDLGLQSVRWVTMVCVRGPNRSFKKCQTPIIGRPGSLTMVCECVAQTGASKRARKMINTPYRPPGLGVWV